MPNVPDSERDKLYPFLPSSLIPAIAVTLIVFAILIVDISTGESTNVVVFYLLPFLFTLILFTQETVPIFLNSIGLRFDTLREKIVGVVSIPAGIFLGYLLVQLATAPGSVLPVATFPFVASSLSTAGQGFILSLAGNTAGLIVFFGVVGFFEEVTSILLGKSISNWLFKKGIRASPLVISIVGYLVARFILVSHHFIAYGGFNQPALYFVAFFYFAIFTIFGIITGMIAKGAEVDANKVIPIMSVIMIVAHWVFDVLVTKTLIG